MNGSSLVPIFARSLFFTRTGGRPGSIMFKVDAVISITVPGAKNLHKPSLYFLALFLGSTVRIVAMRAHSSDLGIGLFLLFKKVTTSELRVCIVSSTCQFYQRIFIALYFLIASIVNVVSFFVRQ